MSDYPLPDRRLAQAFHFTGEDLHANRNGHLTWRQRNRSEDWLILMGRWVQDRLGVESMQAVEKSKGTVTKVCGRIRLDYKQTHIQSLFHADFKETYSLHIDEHDIGFYITREQYHLLLDSENLLFQIYFLSESGVVLSIERLQHCPDIDI